MGIDDPKLKENLGKATVTKQIREAIEIEHNKTQAKAFFSKPKGNEENINKDKNRALFGEETFDNLGIPHEVLSQEKEGFELGD